MLCTGMYSRNAAYTLYIVFYAVFFKISKAVSYYFFSKTRFTVIYCISFYCEIKIQEALDNRCH